MDADEAMPFSMEELNVVEEPDMPMEEGMNKGGYVKGYAEGGPVIDPSVGNMALPDFLKGVSIAGNTSEEYKTYKNDAGLTMTVRFVNGKPTAYIPPGYSEVSATDTVEAGDTTTTETKVEEEKGSGGENATQGKSFSDMTSEELGKTLSNHQRNTNIVAGLVGAVNPVLGMMARAGMNAQGKAAAQEAVSRLGATQDKALSDAVRSYAASSQKQGIISKALGISPKDNIATEYASYMDAGDKGGQSFNEAYNDAMNNAGRNAPGSLAEALSYADPYADPYGEAMDAAATQMGGEGRGGSVSSGGGASSSSAPSGGNTSGGNTSGGASSGGSSSSSGAAPSGTSGQGNTGGASYGGSFWNEGGLVTKPKRKKK
jgi:hypothetical protein